MCSIITKRIAAGLAGVMLAVSGLHAKTGAPHSLVVSANFTDVSLAWCAPESAKDLKWHSGRDYNGDAVSSTDGQKLTKTYVAAKFDADDLRYYAGETVEAITFFQYRPVYRVTVMVYEDGNIVSQAQADPAKYIKNTPLRVALPDKVEIKAGSEYLFAVCFEAGSNMDFIAIKDEASNASGKGDLMSTDGKNWVSTGNGEYLITANLANDVDETPKGYNIYRGDVKINESLVEGTSLALEDQPAGDVSYVVSAVYENAEYKSSPWETTLVSYASLLPSPASLGASVNELDVRLEWMRPLLGGNELTWTDKSKGISIGGTASKDTKVWVRNQFDASDLIAFRGGSISAINFNFSEAVISGVTLFVTKDGAIDYYETVADGKIAEIKAGEWVKFTLSRPYGLEDGHDYGYGLYVLHTPKAHPISVDNSVAVNVKGNSFSVSSPASNDFSASKPSWKTLKSGGMDGNWLMTADIEGSPAAITAPSYDIYRDGQKIGSGVNGLSFDDKVGELGEYVYSVVSCSGDNVSLPVECRAVVKLPAAYSAPLVENASFDRDTKRLEIAWNMDKEISHCGEATYLAGFDEDMSLMWGSQFTAAELSAYKGYSIKKLKFAVGADIGDFSVGVYDKQGNALSKIDIPAGSVEAQTTYTVNLPEAVAVTGEQDLIFAYSGTIPGGKSAIILDEGPLVDGGAKISLTGGVNWLNLSTLNPAYAKYNIFISAMASEDVDSPSQAKFAEIGTLNAVASSIVKPDRIYGVEGCGTAVRKSSASRSSLPAVKGFNVYCNGEKIAETTDMEYTETITRFASFTYYVTTVFANGWESLPSESMTFVNRIAQKSVAPFGLVGEMSGDDLQLKWQSPEHSTVLGYVPDGAEMTAMRMTGNSTIKSYCASKFPASELSDCEGYVISHIQFGCGSTEISSAAVIVMYGENIVYTQTVPVSTLVNGLNDVRLNEPVEIPVNTDVWVGFIMSYTSSTPHPLGCFESEDHTGLGDLISSSGSSGYWYSLHTKFISDYCWYIRAILASPDVTLSAKAESLATVKYNVYCDGSLVANVAGTGCTIKNAQDGKYYVTAVSGDGESGESNAVVVNRSSGIDDIKADGVAVNYEPGTGMLVIGAEADVEIYSASGSLVASDHGSSISVAGLGAGVYTVRVSAGDGVTVHKFVK